MDKTVSPMSIHDIFKVDTIQNSKSKKDAITVDDASQLPVLVSDRQLTQVDRKIIDPKYYNSFNFSKLASVLGNGKMTIGITSANRQDGKTLVASNMAVSLARGYKQKTLLVDMNFHHPDLHTIFGTNQSPGLAEAIAHQTIRVVPTSVNNLFLMTAGSSNNLPPGIEDTLILRQVLYALKEKFDFVIIDMGAILPFARFPVHFVNEIDGLISVIDSQKTKKAEFKKIFKHINESQFIGFVFNRVSSS